ncbi:MAG: thiamine diphosphokinase [Clostridiales bacterium]|nr:thiamine diphosphokinase [Clostridiales bacterium]
MEPVCYIFGAGDVFSPKAKITPNDIVIAADGGYAKAVEAGFEPRAVIGDFDSSPMPENVATHVIKLNRDKDDTDMLAAVKLGLRRGYKLFVLYGGVGGRLDHTVANFATLKYLNSFDARGYLIDRDSVATVITDGKLTLPKKSQGTVSVFAYGGEAEGVSYKNLDYILSEHTLTPDFPLGVSNATTTQKTAPAEISVKHGSLLIFFPRI